MREVVDNRRRFRREYLLMLSRANSLYVPAGRWPTRGWFLLDRASYNNISKYTTNLMLEIGPLDSLSVQAMSHLSIVNAQCVTRGLASDLSAIYLIEVTDARGVAASRWFDFPLTAQYNIRAPGYAGCFYTDSLNSGIVWTWSTMLQNIWDTISATVTPLGSWPGLPVVPSGTPEGFWFAGVPAWYQFCDVLKRLGMSVACDLTHSNPFTIVNSGYPDPALAALQTKYSPAQDDLEWIDKGAARAPASVTVLFRRRNEYYGSEETVRLDTYQWSTDSYYQVSISAPVFFTGAVGKHFLWSDFTVEYDQDGSPLAGDITTAGTIAAEMVSAYYKDIYDGTAGMMDQTYDGARPFKTGSLVDGVCWYQDQRSSNWQGWRTNVVRGYLPPWPGVYVER